MNHLPCKALNLNVVQANKTTIAHEVDTILYRRTFHVTRDGGRGVQGCPRPTLSPKILEKRYTLYI